MKSKKAPVEFSLSTIQANTAMKKQLEGYIEEIVLHKNKMKDASLGIKDIRGEAKDSLGIPPKILNKLVKEKMDSGSIEAEMQDLETVQAITQVMEN